MGSAVSLTQRRDKSEPKKDEGIGSKLREKTIPVQNSPDSGPDGATLNYRHSSNTSPNRCSNNNGISQQLQVETDFNRGRSCQEVNSSPNSPDSPFVIRSAISNNTILTTPGRMSSSRSSSSSRNHHHSGPSSVDSRAFAARDAIDFLYRRTQMSESSSPNENTSDNASAADVFAQTAMSLGLDNDDLLFNMMFFDDGSLPNFGSMINTMQQETLALHSENNTPYKLNPANEKAISHLIHEKYKLSSIVTGNECAVCKDEIEDGADITRIPQCRHYFHQECLSRWIQLQAWCPVCRSSLDTDSDVETKKNVVQHLRFETIDENDICSCGQSKSTIVEGDEEALLRKMRHSFANNTAEDFISAGLGRVVGREVGSKE